MNVLIAVTALAIFVMVRLPVTSTAGFMSYSARVGPPISLTWNVVFQAGPQDLPILVPCSMPSTHVLMTFKWSVERERIFVIHPRWMEYKDFLNTVLVRSKSSVLLRALPGGCRGQSSCTVLS